MGRIERQEYVIFQMKAKPETAGIYEFRKVGTSWDQIGNPFDTYGGYLYDIDYRIGNHKGKEILEIKLIFLSQDRKMKEVFKLSNTYAARSVINRVFNMGKEAANKLAIIKVFVDKDSKSGGEFVGSFISYGEQKIEPKQDPKTFNSKMDKNDKLMIKWIEAFKKEGSLPGEAKLNSDIVLEGDSQPVKGSRPSAAAVKDDDTPFGNDEEMEDDVPFGGDPGSNGPEFTPEDDDEFAETEDDDDLPF